MRLGIVFDHFRRERGGAERYLAELAARLAARGHEVRVYCRDGEAPSPVVQIVPIDVKAWTRGAAEREFAERACARARADDCRPLLGVRHVVDVDVYQPHGGSWAAARAARLGARPSALERSLRRAGWRWSAKQRWFEFADREVFARRPGLLTLAVSPLVAADLRARFGEFAPRIEVVWPAIDLERIDAAAKAPARGGAPRLVFIAQDFALKGLAAAIAAFARSNARRGGAELVVAGRDRAPPYRRLARRLGVAQAVRFAGAKEDVAALLAASDLLIHPTHYDPCALVTLEALAAGVPVVTTRRNGAAELIERGGGRVVETPDDAAALAGAIDALLADGARSRDEARAIGRSLGWPEHVARIEPLLERGWQPAADVRR